MELDLEPTVKTRPQNRIFRFTHRASHIFVTPDLFGPEAAVNPVVAVDRTVPNFSEEVSDRRPQLVTLRVKTPRRVRAERKRFDAREGAA